jgi:hypothetical protein
MAGINLKHDSLPPQERTQPGQSPHAMPPTWHSWLSSSSFSTRHFRNMQQTPREVHDRIYREALQYIKQHSKFPYVAYTEHLSAVVSEISRRLLLTSRRMDLPRIGI